VRFLGRAFLFCFGLLLAISAGLITLGLGVVIEPAARELVAALGIASLETFLSDLWQDRIPAFETAELLLKVWVLSTTLLILPPAFFALIGEIAGMRSFVWYGLGTGALTAALPWLGRGGERWSDGPALGAEARITTLLFLTGAVAGLTYWLIAGRSAGRDRPPSTGGAEPGSFRSPLR
jgi:hypothetical protein